METRFRHPICSLRPPVREIIELGKSQLGFMNMFAIPLFQGVTDVMPGMSYCVDELQQEQDGMGREDRSGASKGETGQR
jgi:3',5'-cyclic-nucleotide phosphodiesterase